MPTFNKGSVVSLVGIAGILAILIGAALLWLHVQNDLGKRQVQTSQQTPSHAQVVASKQSATEQLPMGESAVSHVYAVETTFALPGQGTRRHDRRFDREQEAQAWASRFAVGTVHEVYPHPFLPEGVFLKEEITQRQPAALVIGIIFLLLGIATLLFAKH